jgi:hypothetical protein
MKLRIFVRLFFIYTVIRVVVWKVPSYRYVGQSYLKEAISNGFSLVLFDFAGSGNSEGDYVSLGTFALTQ